MTLWCLRTFSDSIKAQANSLSKQISKDISLADLQLNTSEFYLTNDHRLADLYINGGNYGESIKLEILNLNDSTRAHYVTWTQIANGQQQSLVFDQQGQIWLFDNCVTQGCNNVLEFKFTYHQREYLISFKVNVTQ